MRLYDIAVVVRRGIIRKDHRAVKRGSMLAKAEIILNKVFGYDEFRPLQAEIITSILNKKDILVIMPTGGGKSLCYQIPALISEGLTVVVSPLISLMKDQVEQMRELGIEAVFLNSTLTPEQYRENTALVMEKKAKLLYVAPESLLKQSMLDLLSSLKIDCIAIDEAHCISEWGHDFRPEYRQIVHIRKRFPDAACVALTATATPRVREDIVKNLNFSGGEEFLGSFDRENLFIQVAPKENPLAQTLQFLEGYREQSGIIYCFSRKQVDDLSDILIERGYSARPYHAGLSDKDRSENQELFIRDDIQIIIATIAFGMGINKPNVRFVIHYDLPKNIESYYQEIGRAGRDGLRSHCLLLFSYGDILKIKYFFKEKNDNDKRMANLHLDALVKYAESGDCRRTILLGYFGEKHEIENCGMCDNCLNEKKAKVDITIPARKFLSCVIRAEEMFGAGHIIDVLRGSEVKKVLNFNHQNLSTYGIGREFSKKQWLHLSRQFVQSGLLVQDAEFGSLKVTEIGRDVLKGEEPVFGYLEADWSSNIVKDTMSAETGLTYNQDLFIALKKKRKMLADEANIPPYIIFPDKTLIEMAVYFPQTPESLLSIHGVGEAKLAKYGQGFLDIIIEYCGTHQIDERKKLSALKVKSNTGQHHKKRHEIIGEQYNTGSSIKDIMCEFSIKESTVIDNLYKFIQDGNPLRSDKVLDLSKVPETRRDAVFNVFAGLGAEFLRPVFEAFNGEINYDELKVLRLLYLYKNDAAVINKNVG